MVTVPAASPGAAGAQLAVATAVATGYVRLARRPAVRAAGLTRGYLASLTTPA